MFKRPDPYLAIAPWTVSEKGFSDSKSRRSESIFSQGNEYMGVRGFFEEGYSGDSLLGCYYNGSFESMKIEHPYVCKGMATQGRFMVAAPNWLYTQISVDGVTLDIHKSSIKNFSRTLDMRNGILTRSFTWNISKTKSVDIVFERFVSMDNKHLGCQRVRFTSVNFTGSVAITCGVDFDVVHEFSDGRYWTMQNKEIKGLSVGAMGITTGSKQRVTSLVNIVAPEAKSISALKSDTLAACSFSLPLKAGVEIGYDRQCMNTVTFDEKIPQASVWNACVKSATPVFAKSYDAHSAKHCKAWEELWKTSTVTIDGDEGAQQGLRFCIFQLLQTYHGADTHTNVGAKGLTGEVYWGSAFWDIETYCLPFYALTCPPAAHNLIGFRHRTLPQAKAGALERGCEGARYPMVTIDGNESCGPWQYGELEIHVSAAVAFAAWHYYMITKDEKFIQTIGLELLIEISRYFASRGLWNKNDGSFGFYGVMGPDEFHMMVHNNHYTNTIVKNIFEFTCSTVPTLAKKDKTAFTALAKKTKISDTELATWKNMAKKMRSKQDPKTGLIEQFDGFFDLPHIEVAKIPLDQIPIQSHWVYTRIFERDMIKQPDVLMLQFLYGTQYTAAQKKVNFDFYEPRCAHESSLSPSIHSIIACEIGYEKMAYDYLQYSMRLDLDDFNRNTREGLHVTSMGAAWMNVTYGYAGMKTDGDLLVLSPTLPQAWNGYSFRIIYRGSLLEIAVNKEGIQLNLIEGSSLTIKLYGKSAKIGKSGFAASLQ